MSEYQLYINKLTQKILCGILIFMMIAIPISHYIALKQQINGNIIANTNYFCAILLFLILGFGIIQGGFKFNFKSLVIIFIALMSILAIISTFTSIEKNLSIWGRPGRYEGIFTLLGYFIVFLSAVVISEKKYQSYLINAFLIVGVFHCLYGLGQRFNLYPEFIISKYGTHISGVTGNPDFMGGYTALLIALSAGLGLFTKQIPLKIAYLASTGLFLVTCVFTRTMIGLVGIVMTIIACFIFAVISLLYNKDNTDKTITMIILILCILAAYFVGEQLLYYNDGEYLKEIMHNVEDLQGILNGEITESSGAGRLLVWMNSLTLVKDYAFFGSGPDTFGSAYHALFPLNLGTYYDKAHNEYIQMLITLGIPFLVSYLGLCITCITYSIKNIAKKWKQGLINQSSLEIACLIAILAYMAQACFNISVVDVAPFYWMILGIAVASIYRKQMEKSYEFKLK